MMEASPHKSIDKGNTPQHLNQCLKTAYHLFEGIVRGLYDLSFSRRGAHP
ncbi:MAG: hypothetical protein QW724_04830 [Nitrososphaerota archaeon]